MLPPPDASVHLHRSATGCLACGGSDLTRQAQIVSGFLAQRAWGGAPILTELVCCDSCGFRFFERGLSDAEAARYYTDYRSPAYQRQRRRWEPFYTKARHAEVLSWASAPGRLVNLRTALAAAGALRHFKSVLDHGGSRGDMLHAVSANRKAVFDPSGETTAQGIEAYREESDLPSGWSLILCCQVLEHVSDPLHHVQQLARLLSEDGRLYVEVPPENWRSAAGNGRLRRAWLSALSRVTPLLITADMASAAARIRWGRVPPAGLVAMREHLNFFSPDALLALLRRSGLAIDASGIDAGGQTFAVARKSITAQAVANRASAAAA